MAIKLTYEELEQKIKEFEKESVGSKRLELKLKDSFSEIQRLRKAMDHVPAYVYMKDPQSRYVYANRLTLELFGCSAEELVGCDDTRFFPPDTVKRLREVDSRVFAGEQTSEEIDVADAGANRRVYWEVKTPIYVEPERKTIWGLLGISTDITERKQMEEALRKSEAKYRRVSDNSPAVLYQFMIAPDGEFSFPYVSDVVMAVLGISPEDIMKDPSKLFGMVHPEDQEMLREGIMRSAETLEAFHLTFRCMKDGEVIWIEARGMPTVMTDGGKLWEGFLLDITERKQAEETLRLHVAMMENLAEGVYLIGLDDLLIKWTNEMFEKMFGYNPGEMVGKRVDIVNAPTERTPTETRISIVDVLKETGKWHGEVRNIKRDGTPFWSSANVSLFDHPEYGKVIVSAHTDITERKQAEEALRESEEKYRSMLESMKDATYICSPELRIEYMNPRMISRVGRDATGELCHKAVYDSDQKCSWCVFDQVHQGEHIDYEVADPKDNRYYSVTNSPISHTDGTVSKLTIFHDITEIKNIEAQLQQSRKMESIGTLTGGIAHDFNNILYMITGNAELALEDIPEWNPACANLEEIKAAGLRAAGIVKQLLSFSRKTDQELKPIGVITVIKDALKFLRSTIPTTIEIRKHLPDTDVAILADPVQINQIMMNLCINASQAMEETGGILEITVENVTLDEEVVDSYPDLTRGDHVKLTVSDTGPGIDPEIIDRIFDPYFTTKEVGKGSGMGLAVVLGIIKNHDGAITVDSEPGKGITFNILFPVIAEKLEVETETTDELPIGTETILFVDDEESIVNMTQKMLERLGYAVETRLNPVEALELFKSKPDHFGLVITDMTMPQMTGVKLSERLKGVRSDIPVIICTGHSSLIDEEKAIEMGIAAYVMKPIVKKEIAKTIRKVLDDAES